MSDHADLRRKAEAATPGPWEVWQYDEGLPLAILHPEEDGGGLVVADLANQENPSDPQDRANADYLAAANPATVLSLLDEIERLRKLARAEMEAGQVYVAYLHQHDETPESGIAYQHWYDARVALVDALAAPLEEESQEVEG